MVVGKGRCEVSEGVVVGGGKVCPMVRKRKRRRGGKEDWCMMRVTAR